MKTFFINLYSRLNSFLFVTILITVGLLFIVLPKEKISEDEKRALKQFPILTKENLFSGKYFEDIYFSTYNAETENWSKSAMLEGAINTKEHDANVSISPDGKSIFMYKNIIDVI